MSHLTVVEPKVLDEAHIYNIVPFKMPNHCLFRNYNALKDKLRYITDRSYELPYKWFFLTFKPFNSTYEKNHEFYQKKGIDHIRKKLGKVEAYIITKEIQAEKTHINVLCVSKRDLPKELHGKKTNRYYIYCQECINRHDSLNYILKESKTRYFNEYEDYTSHRQ